MRRCYLRLRLLISPCINLLFLLLIHRRIIHHFKKLLFLFFLILLFLSILNIPISHCRFHSFFLSFNLSRLISFLRQPKNRLFTFINSFKFANMSSQISFSSHLLHSLEKIIKFAFWREIQMPLFVKRHYAGQVF